MMKEKNPLDERWASTETKAHGISDYSVSWRLELVAMRNHGSVWTLQPDLSLNPSSFYYCLVDFEKLTLCLRFFFYKMSAYGSAWRVMCSMKISYFYYCYYCHQDAEVREEDFMKSLSFLICKMEVIVKLTYRVVRFKLGAIYVVFRILLGKY